VGGGGGTQSAGGTADAHAAPGDFGVGGHGPLAVNSGCFLGGGGGGGWYGGGGGLAGGGGGGSGHGPVGTAFENGVRSGNGLATIGFSSCSETLSGTVSAPVSISAGAAVFLNGATIYGPLTADGAAQIAVCDSSIAGQVSVTGTTGPVVIGSADGGSPACTGNSILGPATLTANTGGVELGANTIAGPATLTGNSGAAVTVGANTIFGPLLCSANNPDPTDDNQANTVHGPAGGQCASLG
jgi:hypothetical protein